MPFVTGSDIVIREDALAEGLAKGREEGREEGRKEGRQEAKDYLVAGIEVALEMRFAATGLALLPEIRQVDDVRVLQNILQAISRVDTPDALRRIWTT